MSCACTHQVATVEVRQRGTLVATVSTSIRKPSAVTHPDAQRNGEIKMRSSSICHRPGISCSSVSAGRVSKQPTCPSVAPSCSCARCFSFVRQGRSIHKNKIPGTKNLAVSPVGQRTEVSRRLHLKHVLVPVPTKRHHGNTNPRTPHDSAQHVNAHANALEKHTRTHRPEPNDHILALNVQNMTTTVHLVKGDF